MAWNLAGSLIALALTSLGVVTIGAPTTSAAVTTAQVTSAEQAAVSPNYIFPFMTITYYTVANVDTFQYLMYRPLYWFGRPASATLNRALSLADAPVFSNGDKSVKITLKTYKWSNGEPVTTTDVLFWMNIWHQKPDGYVGWAPGGLSMPTSVKSVKVTTPRRVTITFDRSFNPRWLLYNELSQITPLPTAWTVDSSTSAPGSVGCAKAAYGTNDAACSSVYDYLSLLSGFNPVSPKTSFNVLATFATNPLWKVVDGPWTLTSYGPTAPVVFKTNPAYSGPNKPKIKKYIEKPFATESAEFDALVAGTIDIGYLPRTDLTAPAKRPGKAGAPVVPGRNNPRLGSFTLVPVYSWGVNYLLYNFDSVGDTGNAGAIFRQLYVRQAIQHLVDQTRYVQRMDKGYGYPIYGPVPTLPKNPFSSRAEDKNPYPYSASAAKRLLSSHGWKVVPGGVSTCERAGKGTGDCGKGIKKGARLSFTLQYASGIKALVNLMQAEKSSWAQAGIHVELSSAVFDTVPDSAVRCTQAMVCTWQLENFTGGWAYSPDIYPSGEEIFATGAASNSGAFNTSHVDALIRATDESRVTLTAYENDLEEVLPVVWQPIAANLKEIHKTLAGAAPASPLYSLTPATYHWR